MYINKKTKRLVQQNVREIAIMTWWTLLPVLFSAMQMTAWSLLIWGLTQGVAPKNMVIHIASVMCLTIIQRLSEHNLVKQKARYCNAFKLSFRSELLEKLFILGPAFIERKDRGELITTLWEKVEWINYYLFYYGPTSWMIMLFSAICALVWIPIDPLVSWLIVVSGILVASIPPLFYRLLKKRGETEWGDTDSFYSACLDGLQGIVTLKALNANGIHRQQINYLSEKNRKSIMSNLLLTTINTKVIDILISIGELASVAAGAWAMHRDDMSAYQLLLLLLLLRAWSDGARCMFGAWLRGNKGLAAIEKALEILDMDSSCSLICNQPQTEGDAISIDVKSGIAFSGVNFAYDISTRKAVCDVNFTIAHGSQTAFVGSSGSGKTTIARLLFGFYRPQSGIISIGGIPMNGDTVLALRSCIAVIWQDSHIFHMSCMDNIRMANPRASDEEVYAAAKKANIHDTIQQLPQGYNTIIGDGGRIISGGEKQRIGLARAFLRDTPILILDEATSSLDRKNEKEIQRGIRELSKGKTVLSIAHRLDTIRDMDQICVMENGQIVECGTHDGLLKKSGRYSELMCIDECEEVSNCEK